MCQGNKLLDHANMFVNMHVRMQSRPCVGMQRLLAVYVERQASNIIIYFQASNELFSFANIVSYAN
jgi:hypothetical protein